MLSNYFFKFYFIFKKCKIEVHLECYNLRKIQKWTC